jgi:hypothetical protein
VLSLADPIEGYVSRVVKEDAEELELQMRVRKVIPKAYQKFFVFAEGYCPNFVLDPSDSYVSYTSDGRTIEKDCTLFGKFFQKTTKRVLLTEADGYLNLLTPKLGLTLWATRRTYAVSKRLRNAMERLLKALIHLEGVLVYSDGHDGNIAWNGDKTELVLFDFGRTLVSKRSYTSFYEMLLDEKTQKELIVYKQYFFNVIAIQHFQQYDLGTVQKECLRKVWDLLSLLGTLLFETYNKKEGVFSKWDTEFFPNMEDCALSIIEYISNLKFQSDYSKEKIFEICERTIFQPMDVSGGPDVGRAVPKTLSRK